MTRFLFALAALFGTTSGVWAGATDLFEEKLKDFGTTPRGPVLVHYFRFTNTTNQTINIGQPRVSCGCTAATSLQTSLEPGKTGAIVAYMDTRRIPTPNMVKSVIVYVPVTMPHWEEAVLRVQTVTRDDLIFNPDTIALGNVRKGQGGQATAKISFLSDPNWQITGVTSTGGFIKAEAKLAGRQGSQVTYDITATLDPECPVGNWISDLNLTTSNAGVASLRLPVTVNVVKPVTVSAEQVQLGDIPLGNHVEHRVIIQSASPFKIVGVKGIDQSVVVQSITEEAKPVHVLTLNATPAMLGVFTRTIEVMTDNQEQPKISLTVIGKVISP